MEYALRDRDGRSARNDAISVAACMLSSWQIKHAGWKNAGIGVGPSQSR